MREKTGFRFLLFVFTVILAGSFLCPRGMNIAKTWGKSTMSYYQVVVSGDYAYCLDDFLGLEILDVRNPVSPVQIANFPFPSIDSYLVVPEKHAYIVDGERKLQVIDISRPSSPQRVGTYSLPSSRKNLIFVEDKTAYIPYSMNTLGIFDISEPSAPALIFQFISDGEVRGIFLESNKLYLISYKHDNTSTIHYGQPARGKGVLEIVDVSNKRMPVKLGTWEIDKIITGIWVSGNYAYITLGWDEYSSNGLWVIDVSNPGSPRYLKSVTINNLPRNLKCKYGYAYFSTNDFFYCVKISSPPQLDLSWTLPMFYSLDNETVSEKYAYTVNPVNGMQVIDISQDGKPEILTTFSRGNDERMVCADLQGNRFYSISQIVLQSQCSLDIYNLAGETPVLESKYPLPEDAKDIVVSGGYACVKIVEDKLIIIDISNPASPVKAGEINTQYLIDSLILDGSLLYIQLDSGNFNVYDISNPASPVFRGKVKSSWSHVSIKNKIAYVVDSRLCTYDLTDPVNPVELGVTGVMPEAHSVLISGDYAYISHTKKFTVADIANPSVPTIMGDYGFSTGAYPSISYPYNLFANGRDLFIAANESIFALDVYNPLKPSMIGAYSGIHSEDLYAVDNKIVCVNWRGLTLFSYNRTNSPASIKLSRNTLYFSSSASGTVSPDQSFRISNGGQGNLNWRLSVDSQWLSVSPISGTTGNEVFASVNPEGLPQGRHLGTITVTDPLAENSPRHINVCLEVKGIGQSNPPFGTFEIPENKSTVAGSIAVTGWALDDVGVKNVEIYREDGASLVYIDDAFFVEGARPDVEAAYPGCPNCYRAGWGYMLLTNYLPGGDGEFTLHAIAKDREGNSTLLGTRTIRVDNANSVNPFGAIDTPVPGGTVSGNAFVNFGWALTPPPNTIPLNGSTITVWVDGVPVGNPVYNQNRTDIAGFFPGYNNSHAAGGHFYLDTTMFEDGMHTIQWTATDDAGNRDGIGSRFFYVSSGESLSENRKMPGISSRSPGNRPESEKATGVNQRKTVKRLPGADEISNIILDESMNILGIRRGYNLNEPFSDLDADKPGVFSVQTRCGDRLEIQFPGTDKIQGFHTLGNKVYRLPIGSTLDPVNNRFIWQPGPGFAGEFRLVFIIRDHSGHKRRIHVNITIL